ncbi:MAG: YraN family protein [Thermoanaerobaculia bacterium]
MEAPLAPSTHARGVAAEAAAADWLVGRGYEILERNFDTPAGEIDLVARDGETLCFIEVKARAVPDCGSPLEAVDDRRRRRLGRAASLYLVHHEWSGPCRFDVVGMSPGPRGWSFELVQDAFELA